MTKLVNRTRISKSIPLKLFREGKFYLIPLYYLISLSDLAREGIENSGSYKFADHIYQGVPKGKYGIGKIIDNIFLNLSSAKSFRNRYIYARNEILKNIKQLRNIDEIHILSIPSGIPRDLIDVSIELSSNNTDLHRKVRFHCMDIDTKVLKEVDQVLRIKGLSNFLLYRGDALNSIHYKIKPHIIVSTGLGEFLDEESLMKFYKICYSKLNNKGIFITTSTSRHKLSDYLMRNLGELTAYYRTKRDMVGLFRQIPFSNVRMYNDTIGYQTIIIAEK